MQKRSSHFLNPLAYKEGGITGGGSTKPPCLQNLLAHKTSLPRSVLGSLCECRKPRQAEMPVSHG